MKPEHMILLGVCAAIALGVIAYYLARFLKGKLTLELPVTTVAPKQSLSGTLTVHAKKDIHGLLIVALVGRMRKKTRSSGGKSRSELVDVFRRETVLEEQSEFPAGCTKNYQFEFIAPSSSEVRPGEELLRNVADKMDGIAGAALKLGASAVSMMQGRIYWHVEARLDATGVDLYTKHNVTVDLRHEKS
jgi:hypothetical protein